MNLVLAYGSLIELNSRRNTAPCAQTAWPVELPGWGRSWSAQPETIGFTTTVLGASRKKNSTLNGVVFYATDTELGSLKIRERDYAMERVPVADLVWLSEKPKTLPQAFHIFIWSPDKEKGPTPERPIIQSYIDTCLTGCLALDRDLENADWWFSRNFIRNTGGWSRHWVNDRIYPRRPHIHVKDAHLIDRLLSEERPDEFSAITIE